MGDQEFLFSLMTMLEDDDQLENLDHQSILMEARFRLASMIDDHIGNTQVQNQLLAQLKSWFANSKSDSLNSIESDLPRFEEAETSAAKIANVINTISRQNEERSEHVNELHQKMLNSLHESLQSMSKMIKKKDVEIHDLQEQLAASCKVRRRNSHAKKQVESKIALEEAQRKIAEQETQISNLKTALVSSQDGLVASEQQNYPSVNQELVKDLESESHIKLMEEEILSLKKENQKLLKQNQDLIIENETSNISIQNLQRIQNTLNQSLKSEQEKILLLDDEWEKKYQMLKDEMETKKNDTSKFDEIYMAHQKELEECKERSRIQQNKAIEAIERRHKTQMADLMKTITEGDQGKAFQELISIHDKKLKEQAESYDQQINQLKLENQNKLNEIIRSNKSKIKELENENSRIRVSINDHVKLELSKQKLELENTYRMELTKAQNELDLKNASTIKKLQIKVKSLTNKLNRASSEKNALQKVLSSNNNDFEEEEEEEEEEPSEETDDNENIISDVERIQIEKKIQLECEEKYATILEKQRLASEEVKEWELKQQKETLEAEFERQMNELKNKLHAKLSTVQTVPAQPLADNIDAVFDQHFSKKKEIVPMVPLSEVQKRIDELTKQLSEKTAENEMLKKSSNDSQISSLSSSHADDKDELIKSMRKTMADQAIHLTESLNQNSQLRAEITEMKKSNQGGYYAQKAFENSIVKLKRVSWNLFSFCPQSSNNNEDKNLDNNTKNNLDKPQSNQQYNNINNDISISSTENLENSILLPNNSSNESDSNNSSNVNESDSNNSSNVNESDSNNSSNVNESDSNNSFICSEPNLRDENLMTFSKIIHENASNQGKFIPGIVSQSLPNQLPGFAYSRLIEDENEENNDFIHQEYGPRFSASKSSFSIIPPTHDRDIASIIPNPGIKHSDTTNMQSALCNHCQRQLKIDPSILRMSTLIAPTVECPYCNEPVELHNQVNVQDQSILNPYPPSAFNAEHLNEIQSKEQNIRSLLSQLITMKHDSGVQTSNMNDDGVKEENQETGIVTSLTCSFPSDPTENQKQALNTLSNDILELERYKKSHANINHFDLHPIMTLFERSTLLTPIVCSDEECNERIKELQKQVEQLERDKLIIMAKKSSKSHHKQSFSIPKEYTGIPPMKKAKSNSVKSNSPPLHPTPGVPLLPLSNNDDKQSDYQANSTTLLCSNPQYFSSSNKDSLHLFTESVQCSLIQNVNDSYKQSALLSDSPSISMETFDGSQLKSISPSINDNQNLNISHPLSFDFIIGVKNKTNTMDPKEIEQNVQELKYIKTQLMLLKSLNESYAQSYDEIKTQTTHLQVRHEEIVKILRKAIDSAMNLATGKEHPEALIEKMQEQSAYLTQVIMEKENLQKSVDSAHQLLTEHKRAVIEAQNRIAQKENSDEEINQAMKEAATKIENKDERISILEKQLEVSMESEISLTKQLEKVNETLKEKEDESFALQTLINKTNVDNEALKNKIALLEAQQENLQNHGQIEPTFIIFSINPKSKRNLNLSVSNVFQIAEKETIIKVGPRGISPIIQPKPISDSKKLLKSLDGLPDIPKNDNENQNSNRSQLISKSLNAPLPPVGFEPNQNSIPQNSKETSSEVNSSQNPISKISFKLETDNNAVNENNIVNGIQSEDLNISSRENQPKKDFFTVSSISGNQNNSFNPTENLKKRFEQMQNVLQSKDQELLKFRSESHEIQNNYNLLLKDFSKLERDYNKQIALNDIAKKKIAKSLSIISKLTQDNEKYRNLVKNTHIYMEEFQYADQIRELEQNEIDAESVEVAQNYQMLVKLQEFYNNSEELRNLAKRQSEKMAKWETRRQSLISKERDQMMKVLLASNLISNKANIHQSKNNDFIQIVNMTKPKENINELKIQAKSLQKQKEDPKNANIHIRPPTTPKDYTLPSYEEALICANSHNQKLPKKLQIGIIGSPLKT